MKIHEMVTESNKRLLNDLLNVVTGYHHMEHVLLHELFSAICKHGCSKYVGKFLYRKGYHEGAISSLKEVERLIANRIKE